jgi:hypothetical protein
MIGPPAYRRLPRLNILSHLIVSNAATERQRDWLRRNVATVYIGVTSKSQPSAQSAIFQNPFRKALAPRKAPHSGRFARSRLSAEFDFFPGREFGIGGVSPLPRPP